MNLKIDLKSNEIPQSPETFFVIKKSQNFNYAIEIIIDLKSPINYFNLFQILLSYKNNPEMIVISLGCVFKDNRNKYFITENLSAGKFNKMKFSDFKEWFWFRIECDWKYNVENNLYSLTIFFEKSLCEAWEQRENKDPTIFLKPIYPWSENENTPLEDKTNEYLLKQAYQTIKKQKSRLRHLKMINIRLKKNSRHIWK